MRLIVKQGKKFWWKRREVGKEELAREQYPDLEGVVVWVGVLGRSVRKEVVVHRDLLGAAPSLCTCICSKLHRNVTGSGGALLPERGSDCED